MIGEHAPLAPSSAPQWGYCSGSVSANFLAADSAAQRTREGEASHWVAAEVLSYWARPDRASVVLCTDFLGFKAPNGVIVDDEMVEGADIFVREVLDVCGKGDLARIRVEERTHASQIHEHCWGTYDAAAFLAPSNVLHVWDYKYGHREVSAVKNYQLICYVAGLANEYPINDQTVVIMHVVQPFCYHAEAPEYEWQRTWSGLQPYIERLRQAAHAAMTAPAMTSGIHCRDCAAVGRCSTARQHCYSIVSYVNEPYAIETMAGPDLACERRILQDGVKVAKARLEAVEDQLRDQVSKGDRSSGLTLQNKKGRVKWLAPIEVVIAYARQFGVDVSRPDVLTPAQTEKKIPADIRPAFKQGMGRLTTQGSSGTSLVPAENSRAVHAFKPQE